MKKALLIGINYFDKPESILYGCINDIQNIRNMLIDVYGFSDNNIIMLRDDSENTDFLPTRNNIITQLESIVSISDTLDELWIHYSGHGTRVIDKNNDENTGYDSIIVPIDDIITDDELFTYIQRIQCKAILLFDSCNSGTVSDLQWHNEYKIDTDELIITQNNDKIIDNPNIFVISGSRDDQNSSDVRDKKINQYYGAFTRAFTECLRRSNHHIHIIDLYRNICKFLSFHNYVQIPILSTTHNMNYDFIFQRPFIETKPISTPSIAKCKIL